MPRKQAENQAEMEQVSANLPAPTDWRDADLSTIKAEAVDVVETGDGLPRLKDLNKLVDVPFYVVDAWYKMGDMGEYYGLVCRFPNGSGCVVTAGGQLFKDIAERDWFDGGGALRRPVFLPRGLRASNYTYTERDSDGNAVKETPATSWYIQDNPPDIG